MRHRQGQPRGPGYVRSFDSRPSDRWRQARPPRSHRSHRRLIGVLSRCGPPASIDRFIATASGAAAARLVRKLGADRVIDARRTESIDRLRRFAPDGLNCVLALAGGGGLERCLDFVRPKGRVAHPNGIEPPPEKRRTFAVRSFDAIASPREFARLNRHIANGGIRVPIAAVYPLGKAAQAHRRLDRKQVLGRMVLRCRS